MNKPSKGEMPEMNFQALLKRLKHILTNNWALKLTSLLVALTIWGGLISEDATLVREKTFSDVMITVSGAEQLQRNGLIVISGLEAIKPIRIKAEVPQKVYDTAQAANYSVRVDLSRITQTGEQKLPILSNTSNIYGTVSWMSENEITVKVDEYISRRRVPVQLTPSGKPPEGFYVLNATVDPSNVVISGPRSQVEKVAYLAAGYDMALLKPEGGAQYSAVPFRLLTQNGTFVDGQQISVTSENVLLDTLLVEQMVYPTKQVGINLTGLVTGKVAQGYEITRIKADPELLQVAGAEGDIDDIKIVDLLGTIDVTGMNQHIIRALRVDRPAGVVHLSENAVYVTVDIQPIKPSVQSP